MCSGNVNVAVGAADGRVQHCSSGVEAEQCRHV